MSRILLCLLLCGCATATKLKTGDGDIYRVECNGMATPLSVCYKKANDVCANGWDQVDKDSDGQAVITPSAGAIGTVYKSITVKCR